MPPCPTPCDATCGEVCHEVHALRRNRSHQPLDCPAIQDLGNRTAHTDVALADFPMTIELFRVDTREVVWRKEVTHPQGVWIPPVGTQLGVLVGARVTRASGHVEEWVDGDLS